MSRTGGLAMALLLAGPAAAEPASYGALGTEPFWSLDISRRTMTFQVNEEAKVRQATPRPRKTRFGLVYWTPRISVAVIRNQRCSDGMSDYVYRDDVTVTVDGRKFIGCGGPRRMPKGAR